MWNINSDNIELDTHWGNNSVYTTLCFYFWNRRYSLFNVPLFKIIKLTAHSFYFIWYIYTYEVKVETAEKLWVLLTVNFINFTSFIKIKELLFRVLTHG